MIDTPGLFNTELTNEEIQREITYGISMTLPGPHVFMIVLNLGQRFTQEEATSVKIIRETFGENSPKYTMVLFTRGDYIKNKSIEQYLGKPGSEIRNLIEACGNRFHVFNNKETGDQTQVTDLLKKIDAMVKANSGSFYSCKMFRKMEREIQEQQKKILMEKVELLMRERVEEDMKTEKETLRNGIEQMRQERDQIKSEKEKLQNKYDTETERLMNRVENERKKREEHEIERERERNIFLMNRLKDSSVKWREEKKRDKDN